MFKALRRSNVYEESEGSGSKPRRWSLLTKIVTPAQLEADQATIDFSSLDLRINDMDKETKDIEIQPDLPDPHYPKYTSLVELTSFHSVDFSTPDLIVNVLHKENSDIES